MRYNLHLWRLDETGHWAQYAACHKPDGSVTKWRDTQSETPPTWSNAVYGDIPTADTARNAIFLFNAIRLKLPNAEAKRLTETNAPKFGLDFDAAVRFLESAGKDFIGALLSFPRFVTSGGNVEIGGVDFFELWENGTPLPKLRFTRKDGLTDDEVTRRLIAEERRKRGGFDETVSAFCDTVSWIGDLTRTSKAAFLLNGKISTLVAALESLGETTDVPRIDRLANEAENELLAMCAELADRKNAQPTTAQVADGDEIARKVVDSVDGQLKDIGDNLRGAIDELAAEMAVWREWVRELAKHPNAKPSEPNLCATVQVKICEIWQRFKNAPADCELPSGAFRKTKRTFAECLALHGKDEVWHGKRLIDFIPDEKAFERVVHNGAEKARQAKAKAKPPKPRKRKTQARRKK